MRKGFLGYSESGGENIIREEGLEMQTIDTKRVLIIEAEKEERL